MAPVPAQARDVGRGPALAPVRDALFRGYFAAGRDLNDDEDLAALAGEAGLNPEEVRAFLDGGTGAEAVWESQRAAAGLGIAGVPFYVVDGRYAVSGGQPTGVWLRAFEAIEAERIS